MGIIAINNDNITNANNNKNNNIRIMFNNDNNNDSNNYDNHNNNKPTETFDTPNMTSIDFN